MFQQLELPAHKGQILSGEEQSFSEGFQTVSLFGYFSIFFHILLTTFNVVLQDHA